MNASVSSKHYPVLLLPYVSFTNIEIKLREKRGRKKKGRYMFQTSWSQIGVLYGIVIKKISSKFAGKKLRFISRRAT